MTGMKNEGTNKIEKLTESRDYWRNRFEEVSAQAVELDKKIKELGDWKEFAIKEIFEWHKIAEHLSDKMKIGDYLPTRCLEIIKELEDENKRLKIDIEEKEKR